MPGRKAFANAFRLIALPALVLALSGAGTAFATDFFNPEKSGLWAPPVTIPPANRPPASDATDAATYERCMTLARQNPEAARDLAQSWRAKGGAHPADHCFAVALIGLKEYKEAATRLEALQQAMVHAPATLRGEVLGQAAQAWMLAGDAGHAYTDDTGALAIRPDDPDLLVDRAEAAGAAGWYDKAVADLDKVLKIHPSRLDALIFRASANRALNHLDPALADIDQAAGIAPDSPEVLLERGYIRVLRGDVAGARQDWLRVAALAPNSADAATAKTYIARLDAPPGNAPNGAAPPPAKLGGR